MFNIIGADGKQYGPVTVDQIRQWIQEGRASGATQIQLVGSDAWKPLREFPEFAADAAGSPPRFSAPPITVATTPGAATVNRAQNKVPAGICGILLGTWGVHKFILGFNTAGFTMLGISLALLVIGFLTCGLALPLLGAVHIIGVIEGIIYLTKTDEEFVRIYVDGRREWF
jgi:TM2 domain-containing membrane protein YozV